MESSNLETTLRRTLSFLLQDCCQCPYAKRLLDKYTITDCASKTESFLFLGYKSKLDLSHNEGIKDNGL